MAINQCEIKRAVFVFFFFVCLFIPIQIQSMDEWEWEMKADSLRSVTVMIKIHAFLF